MAILTMLFLPIHEHGIFLHLFVSSLISFISDLYFSMYKSFVSLGRYIPKYFILFVAMVNGIVSLISLSVWGRLFFTNLVISRYYMRTPIKSFRDKKYLAKMSLIKYNFLTNLIKKRLNHVSLFFAENDIAELLSEMMQPKYRLKVLQRCVIY